MLQTTHSIGSSTTAVLACKMSNLSLLGAKLRRRTTTKLIVYFHTSRWGFVLWWLGLLVLHIANIAYYGGVALLYKMLDKTFVNYQLTVYGIGVPVSDQPKIAKIHIFIAAIHAFFVVLMITSAVTISKYWTVSQVGLLSTEFPKRANFYSAATNLRSLPFNLDLIWPSNMQLFFEAAAFTEIPEVVIHLQPSALSMAGSRISMIKPELIESSNLQVLQISLTLVKDLPPTVKRLHPLFAVLLVQYTSISVFPAWLNGYANAMIHLRSPLFNAYESSYCRELNEIAAGYRTTFSMAASASGSVLMDVSTPEKLAFVRRAVDCTDPGHVFYYSLPVEDMKHGRRS